MASAALGIYFANSANDCTVGVVGEAASGTSSGYSRRIEWSSAGALHLGHCLVCWNWVWRQSMQKT